MENVHTPIDTHRYAKCVEVSKRVRFDIDRDVVRGRQLDFAKKFLPDGLSRIDALPFLSTAEKRFLSRVQGRTYANVFAHVERFIGAKMLELSSGHALGDQTALEALVRFTDEELKHQEMFRRLERMAAAGMPEGYRFLPDPNEVAREESQHAILDEMEWQREDGRISAEQRDRAVDDLIALVGAVDGILQIQAQEDARHVVIAAGRNFTPEQVTRIHMTLLRAYRWQYIVSGVQQPRFLGTLGAMITPAQSQRIGAALTPIVDDVNAMLH